MKNVNLLDHAYLHSFGCLLIGAHTSVLASHWDVLCSKLKYW